MSFAPAGRARRRAGGSGDAAGRPLHAAPDGSRTPPSTPRASPPPMRRWARSGRPRCWASSPATTSGTASRSISGTCQRIERYLARILPIRCRSNPPPSSCATRLATASAVRLRRCGHPPFITKDLKPVSAVPRLFKSRSACRVIVSDLLKSLHITPASARRISQTAGTEQNLLKLAAYQLMVGAQVVEFAAH